MFFVGIVFFFKQKTAYEMRISDWSSDVCSSDLSKKNVAHHYDLSDRLYDLFLDADRQYSCAYFTDRDNSLEQAQTDKKAHIAAKLCLKRGQRVLAIGCGWGGLALYPARVAGVAVMGIPMLEVQLAGARRGPETGGGRWREKGE